MVFVVSDYYKFLYLYHGIAGSFFIRFVLATDGDHMIYPFGVVCRLEDWFALETISLMVDGYRQSTIRENR